MKSMITACAALAFCGCAAASDPLYAGMGAIQDATAKAAVGPTERNSAYLAAAYAEAQGAAERRGDENLSCDQLKAEAFTLGNDPAIAAVNTKMERMAGDRLKTSAAVQGANMAAYGGIAAASLGATGPVNLGGVAAMYAMNGIILGETVVMNSANAAANAAATKEMGALMKNSARSERVYELGDDKDCEFVKNFNAQRSPQ